MTLRAQPAPPHTLGMARRCALPSTALYLACPETADLLDAGLDLEDRCSDVAEQISDQLHGVVAGLADRATRQALLQLRRDIHNDRRPRAGDLTRALRHLEDPAGSPIRRLVERWLEDRSRREELIRDAQHAYTREHALARQRLHTWAADPALGRGILVASDVLFTEMTKWLGKPAPPMESKRIRRTELAVLRYLARAACKPSPFGALTTVSIALLPGSVGDPQAPTIARQVRVNHALVQRWADLLAGDPLLGEQLPVRMATANWRADGRVVAVVRRDPDPPSAQLNRTIETLTSVPDSAVLGHVRDILQTSSTTAALTTQLIGRGAPARAAVACVQRLLDSGILDRRPELAATERDPLAWFGRLIESTRHADPARTATLRTELARLTSKVDCLPHLCDLTDAARALADARDSALGISTALREPTPGRYEQHVVYEDTLGRPSLAVAPTPSRRGVAALQRFLRVAPLYDRNTYHRQTIKHMLLQQHGAETRVPLLPFFAAYTGAVRDAASPPARRGIPAFNPFDLAELDDFHNLQRRFAKDLRSLCATDAPQVEIDDQWLDQVAADIPPFARAPRSYACFYQPIDNTDAECSIVVNDIMAGPARVFARFLDERRDRDAPAIGWLRSALQRDQTTTADINASLGFNGNLHPPLCDLALGYGHTDDTTLPLTDLQLSVEQDQITVHSQRLARELVITDLGLTAPFLHPPLYRFLTQLRGSDFLTLKHVSWLDDDADPSDLGTVAIYPRICYRGVALTRREWRIPRHLLPARGPGADLTHFRAVRRWRRDFDLPETCFVRPRQLLDALRSTTTGFDQSLVKPQYVDLRSSLFARLLDQLREHADENLSIEEALPNPAGTPHVTEYVEAVDVD